MFYSTYYILGAVVSLTQGRTFSKYLSIYAVSFVLCSVAIDYSYNWLIISEGIEKQKIITRPPTYSDAYSFITSKPRLRTPELINFTLCLWATVSPYFLNLVLGKMGMTLY